MKTVRSSKCNNRPYEESVTSLQKENVWRSQLKVEYEHISVKRSHSIIVIIRNEPFLLKKKNPQIPISEPTNRK